MEGSSKRDQHVEETPGREDDQMMQISKADLQRMIKEASLKAIVEYERRTVTQRERQQEGNYFRKWKRNIGGRSQRQPGISRTDVDNVSRQIEKLGKQIEELKKRGEIVSQNRSSTFTNRILLEVVDSSFRFPDLSKYDGNKDPREHVAAFGLVMNLYGQTDPIKAKLFVTTLNGKAQELFTSLGSGTIDSYEQLIHKFSFHFASKRKAKRFNNEVLEVQDFRTDMMVSILIHGFKKGPFASALAQDPPTGTEQLMEMAQKYIDEEEMNAMKDNEWTRDLGRSRGREEEAGTGERGSWDVPVTSLGEVMDDPDIELKFELDVDSESESKPHPDIEDID
ncbi:UNVERIFIED_CONTAM: hypothetical protein Sindi_1304700 [Sesamum indicum]